MKILTWNVNGLRSLKKSLRNVLSELDADIVCFQETKISRNLLPEETALIEGYSSYFSFSKQQSGYSGVATYCKKNCTPQNAEEGLSGILEAENKTSFVLKENMHLKEFIQPSEIYALDSEGRAIITYHKIRCGNEDKMLAIINTYCPRVDPEKLDRHIYKIRFSHLLAAKAKSLCQENYCVIIVGDLNIAHKVIDHCDPGDEETFTAKDYRQWLSSFLTSCGASCAGKEFYDAFRHFHPLEKEAYTCWNTRTGARKTNYGTRIDYILVSCTFLPHLTSCEILSDIQGSDHCPVIATFQIDTVPCIKPPSLCTSLYPEFAGKQQKLKAFFQESTSDSSVKTEEKKVELSSNKVSPVTKKLKIQPKLNFELTKPQKSIADFFTKNQKAQKDNLFPSYSVAKEMENVSVENANFCVNKNISTLGNNINANQSEKWKFLLSGPPKPPLCKGHNKVCVLRTVKKAGTNFGRQFFACSQPDGPATNPESKCNFFQWAASTKKV